MKILGKIVSVLIRIIMVLVTLLFGALIAMEQYLYTEAANSEMPLIQYEGKIYEKEELMARFAAERQQWVTPFVICLVITVVLFVISIVRIKKKKAAKG